MELGCAGTLFRRVGSNHNCSIFGRRVDMQQRGGGGRATASEPSVRAEPWVPKGGTTTAAATAIPAPDTNGGGVPPNTTEDGAARDDDEAALLTMEEEMMMLEQQHNQQHQQQAFLGFDQAASNWGGFMQHSSG